MTVPAVEEPRAPADGAAGRTILAAKVAAAAAVEVDRQARFPSEAVDELRRQRLLSAAVPIELGGDGAGIDEIAQCARVLGQACASTGMIFAMHQIQVWCLMRHAANPTLRAYLADVGAKQLLLASATSEVNVGGDVRTSICALEERGGRLSLTKQAPVISYGDEADAVLATARRSPHSPSSDQVLVVCIPPGLMLEPTSEWDTLGFRGTVSRGYLLRADVDEAMVLTDAYGDISAQTMLPVSHILWASVWLGLAETAARKAQRHVRRAARARPGVITPAATRLAELSVLIGQFRSQVGAGVALYVATYDDPDALGSLTFAVAMNNLKVSAASLVVDAVAKALTICGISGYRQDSELTLGQSLRDAYGAGLMVNTDRVLANNAQLLMASKDL